MFSTNQLDDLTSVFKLETRRLPSVKQEDKWNQMLTRELYLERLPFVFAIICLLFKAQLEFSLLYLLFPDSSSPKFFSFSLSLN